MAATLALIAVILPSGAPAPHGTENGHRAWCLGGVVHGLRSTVPAREFGGNPTLKPRWVLTRTIKWT